MGTYHHEISGQVWFSAPEDVVKEADNLQHRTFIRMPGEYNPFCLTIYTHCLTVVFKSVCFTSQSCLEFLRLERAEQMYYSAGTSKSRNALKHMQQVVAVLPTWFVFQVSFCFSSLLDVPPARKVWVRIPLASSNADCSFFPIVS